MAQSCQGCGAVVDKYQCCPTCTELGRTSFFCTQECFVKNWKEHSKLHALMKRQKQVAAAQEQERQQQLTAAQEVDARRRRSPTIRPQDADASVTAPADRGGGGAAADPPRPAPSAPAASKWDSLAPLPGGSALSDQLTSAPVRRPNAPVTANTSKLPKSDFAGMIGGAAGALQSFVGRGTPQGKPKAATQGAQVPRVPNRAGFFMVPLLSVIGVVGICFAAYSGVMQAPPDGALRGSRGTLSGDVSKDKARLDGPAETEQSLLEQELRAELNEARSALQKHEKMLRYILERFVEKDARKHPPRTASQAAASGDVLSEDLASRGGEIDVKVTREEAAGAAVSVEGQSVPQPSAAPVIVESGESVSQATPELSTVHAEEGSNATAPIALEDASNTLEVGGSETGPTALINN